MLDENRTVLIFSSFFFDQTIISGLVLEGLTLFVLNLVVFTVFVFSFRGTNLS